MLHAGVVEMLVKEHFQLAVRRIAAGEGSDRAPDSCKLCPYYRPDFKFRTCLYAHCPYKKQVNVFRSTPEKWDILYARKKADKNRRP